MYETPFHQSEHPYPPYEAGSGRCRPGYPFLRTALMWVGIAFIAMLAFGAVGWVFGLAFHLLALLFRIALVTAVVAFVWRRVTRRHRRSFGA